MNLPGANGEVLEESYGIIVEHIRTASPWKVVDYIFEGKRKRSKETLMLR